MATSTHYTSKADPENVIIVSKEKDWSNIKVYAKGKVQFQADQPNELRTGKTIEVDGLGTLQLYLASELEVRVNGTRYEASKSESTEKVTNVSVIFWLLTGFSALGLLFIFMASEFLPEQLILFLGGIQLFAVLVYAATAILLRLKIFWFYFVGAGTFTVFTLLELRNIDSILFNGITLVTFLIRVVFLILILRILPTILKRMRDSTSEQKDDVILDQH